MEGSCPAQSQPQSSYGLWVDVRTACGDAVCGDTLLGISTAVRVRECNVCFTAGRLDFFFFATEPSYFPIPRSGMGLCRKLSGGASAMDTEAGRKRRRM